MSTPSTIITETVWNDLPTKFGGPIPSRCLEYTLEFIELFGEWQYVARYCDGTNTIAAVAPWDTAINFDNDRISAK